MRVTDKTDLFENRPIPGALFSMAVPTVLSQLINLIYNMVDAFFIGRTGNPYMTAATTLTLTLVMMNTALSNLFGVGCGSLAARLMGVKKTEEARCVSAFGFWGAVGIALLYSSVVGIFLTPLLDLLGASSETLGFAKQYTLPVIVIGSLPSILSMTLAHILRHAGYAAQAGFGLSSGGVLNMLLDPLFMFVLLPRGQEVLGAALATLLSNAAACCYLLIACRKACRTAPLSMKPSDAARTGRENIRRVFAVGVPSAVLTGLFDLANVCVNKIASAHSDFVLAGMGIVMKVERVPNAFNIGICQGAMPIIAYNYSSGNRARMQEAVRTARLWGLVVSFCSIALFQLFAKPVTRLFLSSSGDARAALLTLGFAALFLRIRCIASPVQLLNYHASFCMQAMGKGRSTMLHAFVRELVFYIPLMFLLDRLFGEVGLAAALPVGETCGAMFALFLLNRAVKESKTSPL